MLQKNWYYLLLLLLIPGVVFAQSGKLRGTVVDQKTKEPLIGANVTVDETNLGASTDIDGGFLIINVPVGTYKLKVTYVGYKAISMSNVRVSQNYTTEANFELPSEDVEVQAVDIVAERPLVNKDYTNTIRTQSAEELAVLPVRGAANVVAMQASVVKDEGTNTIYIRGGRAEEVSVLIDGVSIVNPLSGQASAAFSNLNQNAIEEMQVQTGGFNAEYGSAMSGQINVTTKQAASKYTFGGEVITDGFITPKVGEDGGWGYNVYNLSAGGPVIPDKDLVTFFIAVERQYLGDNDPRAVGGYKPDGSTQSWNYNGKLSVKLAKEIDLKLGGNAYIRNGITTDNVRRQLDSKHQQRFDNETFSAYARLTHNIGANLFYTFQLGYFQEYLESGDNVFWSNLGAYGDTLQNPYLTSQGTNPGAVYSVVQAPGAIFNQYLKSNSSNISINGDVNLQQGSHLLKAGFEFRQYTIRRYLARPLTLAIVQQGVSAWERYKNSGVEYYGYTFDGSESDADDWFGSANHPEGPKTPYYLAAYLQDKVELSDLVLNIGVRIDHFNANEKVVKDPLNPFGARGTPNGGSFGPEDLQSSSGTTSFSPRLGFSFPVTDKAVFHAQYGTFLQMPPLQNVLISKTLEYYYMESSPNSYQIPNPNLKPERTVSYEIGFKQVVSENASVSFTGWYKEIKDLIQARNAGTPSNPAWPNSYEYFENVDFGTVKGFDFILDLRRTSGFAATLNYTLSYANGTGSNPTDQQNITWLQTDAPKMVSPLDYDRRHNGALNVDFRTFANEGPEINGIYPFENFGINVLMSFNSGVPYTQSDVYNSLFGTVGGVPPTGAVNASTSQWNYRLDLRLDRSFKLGPLDLTASLYVINLTDAKNVVNVYSATGEAGNNGWLTSQEGLAYASLNGTEAVELYKNRMNNPFNYGIPRQIRLGIRAEY